MLRSVSTYSTFNYRSIRLGYPAGLPIRLSRGRRQQHFVAILLPY